jgi:CheY-like chemotaxis protein
VGRRNASPLVLLIDDEPDQIEMYQLALELAAFEVIAAYNGREGIACARDREPDAIVLDLRLPDMSGWDVCDALRRHAATTKIPIVILTAAATPTLARQAADAGCAACLLKPCFPDELARTVREVIAPRMQA